MPKLIMTIGTSNSGKSTFAKGYVEKHPNTVEINRDMFRFSPTNPIKDEFQITRELNKLFDEYIEEGKDVLLSDTNLNPSSRQQWLVRALKANVAIEFVVLHTAFVNLFSNPEAVHKLPQYVLTRQYDEFKRFLSAPVRDFITYTFI